MLNTKQLRTQQIRQIKAAAREAAYAAAYKAVFELESILLASGNKLPEKAVYSIAAVFDKAFDQGANAAHKAALKAFNK